MRWIFDSDRGVAMEAVGIHPFARPSREGVSGYAIRLHIPFFRETFAMRSGGKVER
jgi:hypothetical protein